MNSSQTLIKRRTDRTERLTFHAAIEMVAELRYDYESWYVYEHPYDMAFLHAARSANYL